MYSPQHYCPDIAARLPASDYDAKTLRSVQRISPPGTKIDLYTPATADRVHPQRYIASEFRRAYEAQLTEFLPYLLTIGYRQQFRAAAGLRLAGDESLFVENYFEQPVEQVISRLLHQPVSRESIVEVGSLVSTHNGSYLLLFAMITALLYTTRYTWVVFTATQALEHLIRKLNLTPFTICRADQSKLKGGNACWGNYYQSRPHVMVGYLPQTYALMCQHPLIRALLERHQSTPQFARVRELIAMDAA